MYACCRADQSLGYGMSLSCHHSVETPSMIDPRWNMLDWRSKGIFHKVCWGMVGCDGGTTYFYFGITYVCFIPRMLVFVMGLQYQHRFFLYWCQKIAFEGHEQNRKNPCRLKTLMGFVGQTIKPFLTDRIKSTDQNISLFHDNRVINDPVKVCNIFNDYFINAASDIGKEHPIQHDENIEDILCSYKDHSIIRRIKSHVSQRSTFNFSPTTAKEVHDLLKNVDSKKATGYDNVPPKIIKMAADEFASPLTNLINLSIERSCFPSDLKKSELSPLYKCKDCLVSGNYRPLSILPSVSKIFEKIYNQQLYEYFKHVLSDLLSAFRKRYGCQHVLTKLIEDSKRALDNHMHVGLLLLDLSKAFDCLPHRLLICKLNAYGVSRESCSLLLSYLKDRLQRVKLSAAKSDWAKMTKGVPQGSVLGPMLFNIFINDLFYVLGDTCPLYNYADDNTLGFYHTDIGNLKSQLEDGSKITLDWFDENHMKANISKFQSIILKPRGVIADVEFHVSGYTLKPLPCVKLLGVQIDERLSFDEHVSSICNRVSQQINALRRISKYLTLQNRMSIYNAFLTSNFSYCNIVWHFCSNRSMYKLEKVHKQALRVVLNDYISSYRVLLNTVSKPTLYVSRLKSIAIEAYKCYVNENPEYINVMLDPLVKPYDLRGGSRAEQPKVNTTSCGLNTFTYQAAKLWNILPSHIKEADSIFEFKSLLSKWNGPECHCECCDLCNTYNV